MEKNTLTFEELLVSIMEIAPKLINNSPIYKLANFAAKETINHLPFTKTEPVAVSMGVLGDLTFPYTKMGAIDSLDLFGLDELILFSYYWVNRHRYKKVLDLGANLGLHSIFLAKCGYDVTAYEPDPRHKDILAKNLQLNGIENVTIKKKAISDKTGKMDFIRVLGNTTSSHLAGAKDNPYGELKKLTVHVDALRDAIIGVDFVKMDIEGNEAKAICSISSSDWGDLEMMLEVGSEKNAIEIFEHAQQIGLNVFTQQKGWTKAETLSDVPTSYYEGSLFLTKRPLIFWG